MVMKKISETYKEQGIAFKYPIKIKDANGNQTYFEDSGGFWYRYEYDANGKMTYHENSDGFWYRWGYDANGNQTYYENSDSYYEKREYDADGNRTYYENSYGHKRGTPRSQSCNGKVIEVDGKKYMLKEL